MTSVNPTALHRFRKFCCPLGPFGLATRAKWLKFGYLDIYFRHQWVYAPNEDGIPTRVYAMVLANLTSTKPGRGDFAQLLPQLESEVRKHSFQVMFFENVQNARLQKFLERHGYKIIEGSGWLDGETPHMFKPMKEDTVSKRPVNENQLSLLEQRQREIKTTVEAATNDLNAVEAQMRLLAPKAPLAYTHTVVSPKGVIICQFNNAKQAQDDAAERNRREGTSAYRYAEIQEINHGG